MTTSYVVSYTILYSDNSYSDTSSFDTEELARAFMKETRDLCFPAELPNCLSLTMRLTKETSEPLEEEYQSSSYRRMTDLRTDEETETYV